jgi:hypothetical protein
MCASILRHCLLLLHAQYSQLFTDCIISLALDYRAPLLPTSILVRFELFHRLTWFQPFLYITLNK